MYGRANALASYGRVANSETNPLRQIVMLYDGAMRFLNLAALDIESGDLAAKAEHTARALDIVTYLQAVLDFERGGEVARALDSLYSNVAAVTLRASASLDSRSMRRAAELLAPVRDAWVANADAAASSAAPLASPSLAAVAQTAQTSAVTPVA